MADTKIADLTALTSVATGDLIPVVDISDTTDSADGSTKKITRDNIVLPASISDTNTGSSTLKTVTPDGLSGSVYGRKTMIIPVIDNATTLSTGDGKFIFPIPSDFNGMNLVNADAYVDTSSSSGTPTVMIRNVTDSHDMLSTAITIDINEFSSYTATTPSVVDTTYDDVATGDRIAIDCDVAGTGTKGLQVILVFQTP